MEQYDQQTSSSPTASLLTRTFMFLEDQKWKKADEYFERILDMEPQNAYAYLGKLMVELKVPQKEELQNCRRSFESNEYYQKAVRFGDNKLKAELAGYISHINTRGTTDPKKLVGKSGIVVVLVAAVLGICLLFVIMSTKKSGTPKQPIVQSTVPTQIAETAVPTVSTVAVETTAPVETVTQDDQYAAAVALMDAGKYDEAITEFEKLGDYKDSVEKLTECNLEIAYNEAVSLLDAGKTVEGYEALMALDGYKDSAEKAASVYNLYKLKTAGVGDYVTFGQYEQDNNLSNGKEDIQWQVLDIRDGKVLVISKYALDCQRYNFSYSIVTWEDCTLRTWLNETFLNTAFSQEEQAMIPEVAVSAGSNPSYRTDPGSTTWDRVFLLSIEEASGYFRSDDARTCEPTAYAVSNGAYKNRHGNCFWWLRSPGSEQSLAAGVTSSGEVYKPGDYVVIDTGTVRPAMWITLEE